MLIIEITFCWRMMHVCQHVYITFVLPNHGCQVTPHPSFDVTLFQFEILSKILCGMPFQFSLDSSLLSYYINHQISQEKKKTVHVELTAYILNPSCKFCHSCESSCHCTSCMCPIVSKVHSVICISLRVTECM